MSVLTKEFIEKRGINYPEREIRVKPVRLGLWSRYLSYAEKQEEQKVLWYLKAIMVIPCAIMIPSIIAMSYALTNYEVYAGFTVLLFFSNVIVHIAEAKSRVFVPLYHLSILLMILIPLIANLIQL